MNIKTEKWPVHDEDERQAVNEVLLSGCTNYWTGTHCQSFEKEFAAFVGTKHAIAVMNGTVALEAALVALDIGRGDEVITTCRTFIASASCIVMRGAKPVLADVDINSQNITAETIESCITKNTKAIIVVHLAGWPADMPAILALAKKYNLKVIEDCAQAHGATIQNRMVGSWGDVAAFSFCQDKIITTGGEGGMITTNDDALFEKIWSYKDHGKNHQKAYQESSAIGFKWLHDSFGTNWRMTEMQAAIGRIQLRKLPSWLQIRKRNATLLNQQLNHTPGLRVTLPTSDINHAYYKYYVFVEPHLLKKDWHRNRIIQALHTMNVACFTGSCSEIYHEQAFKHIVSECERKPIARVLGETSLMFLVHPTLSEESIKHTANSLSDVMSYATVSVNA